MMRRKFSGVLAGLVSAGALAHGPLARDASASGWATTGSAGSIPVELVIDDEVIEIDDPYCPTCYDAPTKLVSDTDTEATLTLDCDELAGETSDGSIFVEVQLDDGHHVRIHRQSWAELCADQGGPIRDVSLHAGPDWTWGSVSSATVSVVGG